jgi:hypothetical protein
MIAITTKYLGPTNVKGSRIKAIADGGFAEGPHTITIGYDHSLNTEQAHLKAAVALKSKMNWKGKLIGGGIKMGYAFVFIDSDIKEGN